MDDMRYDVLDWYEGREVIAKNVDVKTAKKLMKQREEDTDGECYVMVVTHACQIDMTEYVENYFDIEEELKECMKND